MSKKRVYAMINVEDALQDVPVEGLAVLLYRKWFKGHLTLTCPDSNDSVEIGAAYALNQEEMENLFKLKNIEYKITSVGGRIRLKFSIYNADRIADYMTSPFSKSDAEGLFKNEQYLTPHQVNVLVDFIFLVFRKLPVETIPIVEAKTPIQAKLRFKISSMVMNEAVFRELFTVQECTNDIYSFKIVAAKDMLELIVEFVFMYREG